jgi:hypothetical protein
MDYAKQIEYAEGRIEYYKDCFLKTDQYYFYRQALNWMCHRADIFNESLIVKK